MIDFDSNLLSQLLNLFLLHVLADAVIVLLRNAGDDHVVVVHPSVLLHLLGPLLMLLICITLALPAQMPEALAHVCEDG